MAEILVTNNAVGTLSSSISDSDLTLTLAGQGSLFPNPTGGDYFWATIVSDANDIEIVKCTARATNTLTIVRAEQSTTAMAFDAGSRVELRHTAGHHDAYAQVQIDNEWEDGQTFPDVSIAGAAATARPLDFKTGTEKRIRFELDNTAESGSNAGSDFYCRAYDDDDVLLGTVFKIARATRVMTDKSGNKFDAFASGVAWPFYNTSAPTGWTIVSQNNKALRVVSSNGGVAAGTTAFTDVFTGRTITANNLPTHTHAAGTLAADSGGAHTHTTNSNSAIYGGIGAGVSFAGGGSNSTPTNRTQITIDSGGAHIHTISGNTGNNTTSATAIDFAVQYCDVIICSKDA